MLQIWEMMNGWRMELVDSFGARALGKAVLNVYTVLTLGNKCWICICKIWTEAKMLYK